MNVHVVTNICYNLAKRVDHSLTFSEDGVFIFTPQPQLKQVACNESYIFLLQGLT